MSSCCLLFSPHLFALLPQHMLTLDVTTHTLIRRYHCNSLMVIHLSLHFGSDSDWTLLASIYHIALINYLVYTRAFHAQIYHGVLANLTRHEWLLLLFLVMVYRRIEGDMRDKYAASAYMAARGIDTNGQEPRTRGIKNTMSFGIC